MDDMLRQQLQAEVARGGYAYIRNLAAAEHAILRGQFNVAKVLRAAAHAQRVTATEAARLLEQDADENAILATILDEINPGNNIHASQADSAAPYLALERAAVVRAGLRDILDRALASLQRNADVLEADVNLMLWGCYGCGAIYEGDRPHACDLCGALSVEFEWFGPFYSATPEHLGQLNPTDIIGVLREIPDQVTAAIDGADDAGLRRKPTPEEWSAAEVIGHMLETDKLFVLRAKALLEKQGVELPRPMPPWKLHEGKGYETMPAGQLLAMLRVARGDCLALLNSLEPEDWTRTGLILGAKTSLLDLGTWLANHDRGHLAQVRNLCRPGG